MRSFFFSEVASLTLKYDDNKPQKYDDNEPQMRIPCQTSKMERFAKIVNGFQPLIIFPKGSILDA